MSTARDIVSVKAVVWRSDSATYSFGDLRLRRLAPGCAIPTISFKIPDVHIGGPPLLLLEQTIVPKYYPVPSWSLRDK